MIYTPLVPGAFSAIIGEQGYLGPSGLAGSTWGVVGRNYSYVPPGFPYGIGGVLGYAPTYSPYATWGVAGVNYSYYGAGLAGFTLSPYGTGARGYGGYYGVGVRGYNPGLYFGAGVYGLGGVGVVGTPNSAFYGPSFGLFPYYGYGVLSLGPSGATGAKLFLQPHPEDADKIIAFAALEGPESATFFRGSSRTSEGAAVIEVPEAFRLASEADQLTVQVTAREPASLWVESRSAERIVVRSDRDVPFDYFVNGVRRGFAEHKPIRENKHELFVPKVRGEPYGLQYPEGLRDILVQNGTLNPDFTPNEAVAADRGWELKDRTQTARVSADGAARAPGAGRRGAGRARRAPPPRADSDKR